MLVSKSRLPEILKELAHEDALFVDTETYGLKHEDMPFSLAICGLKKAYYLNFKEYEGLHANFVLDTRDIRDILKSAQIVYAHNAKFDIQMLKKIGVTVARDAAIHCTAANERLLKNSYGHWKNYSLAACSERRGFAKDDTVEKWLKTNLLWPHYDRVPIEMIAKYAINDVILCREIGLSQTLLDSRQEIQEQERLFTEVLCDMQWNGVRVDTDYLEHAIAWHQTQEDMWKHEYHGTTNAQFIDSANVLKAAFTLLGEATPLTEKGNPSLNAKALDKMESPLANIVKKIRYHSKMGTTYFKNIKKELDSKGVIHPDAIQHGTETGRISCREPNMNNLPNAEPFDLFPVKKCFIPRDGNIFVFIDYKQQEYRLLLDLVGEHEIIAKINAGLDVHTAVAEELGVTRNEAKTLNFAIVYGQGPDALASSLKIEPQEAKKFLAAYFAKLKRVANFIRDTKYEGKKNLMVKNPFGRHCYITDQKYAYILPNHKIQGGCADIMKKAMNNVRAYIAETGLETVMVGQVYDELILEMPKQELSNVENISNILKNAYTPKNGLPMDVSIEYSSTNWHDIVVSP